MDASLLFLQYYENAECAMINTRIVGIKPVDVVRILLYNIYLDINNFVLFCRQN